MIFDPVLDSIVLTEDDAEILLDLSNQPIICAHCYRPIKGKFYQSGKNLYDTYCWQFRFVIDPIFIERATRNRNKDTDEEEE